MRSLWTRGVAVALGVVAGTQAQEYSRPPVVTFGKPIAVQMGKPRPLPAPSPASTVTQKPGERTFGPTIPAIVGATDSAITPVSFSKPVVRGVAPDPTPVRAQAGIDRAALGMYGWRRPEENVTVPPLMPPPLTPTAGVLAPGTLPAPSVVNTGPVYSTPISGSGQLSAPALGTGLPTGTLPEPGATIAGTSPSVAIATAGPVVGPPCDACVGGVYAGPADATLAAMGGPGGSPFDNRFYAGFEYLLWAVRGDQTPALVTQAPPGGAPALGVGGTQILYGDRPLGNGPRSGGRLNLGWWLSPEHCLGVDVGGFFLGEKVSSFLATSVPGGPVIGRPFFNRTPNLVNGPDYELVGGTDINDNSLAGAVSVRHSSSLWGYDVNLRRNWLCGPCFNLDWLVGYRQMGLDETLLIREDLNLVDGSGARVSVQDRFATQNRFYGGQVGLVGEVWLYNRVTLGGFFKLGLGYTAARTTIDGFTSATVPGQGTLTGPGGLYTGATNIGHYTRHSFSVVPELGFNIGYAVTDWMRLTVGYNFLYWNNVSRPGAQVDTNVNLNNDFGLGPAAPPLVPRDLNHPSDFSAH
ncbi:MAG: BBP7 family outer membrane beta-barrel protein, partial [Gemmataceae bacterium]